MKGNEIIASTDPRGVFMEGFISGSGLKPGTLMQVKNAVEPILGKFTYEVYSPGTGDGTPKPVIVLREDHLQGKGVDDAYSTGTRCFLYMPAHGEMLNVRKADISGTGSATEDLTISQMCTVVDGTGKIAGTPVGVAYAGAPGPMYPFTCMETLVDQPAEMLVYCMFNGITCK